MKKGFTLIELLIVIVIIGIIASLAVVGLNSVRSKSRDAKRISDVRQLQNALEIYRNDNSVYPSAITSGQPLIGENDYTYMSAVPTAPGINDGTCTSDTYAYESTNTSTTYSLTYCLGGTVQNVGPGNLSAIPGDIGVVVPAEEPAPEQTCGNGVVEGTEVCDSNWTSPCAMNADYYKGGYIANEADPDCPSWISCSNDCTACRSAVACNGIM